MKKSLKKLLSLAYLFIALAAFGLLQTENARAATLFVNSNSDNNLCDGVLTLREAMLLAAGQMNRSITFSEKEQIEYGTWIPGPPCTGVSQSYWTLAPGGSAEPSAASTDWIHMEENVTLINVTSALPELSKYDRIFGNNTVLDGSSAPANTSGLVVNRAEYLDFENRVEITGFTIRNFQGSGIVLYNGADGSWLYNLKIHNNRDDGIVFYAGNGKNPRNNRIGYRNVSGNPAYSFTSFIYSNGGSGIRIEAFETQDRAGSMNNLIENVDIGVGLEGNVDLGNGQNGIVLQHAFGNIIGTEDNGFRRSTVSGNNNDGILITGNGATGNRIINTNIGTDITASQTIGNSGSGIALLNGAGVGDAPNYIGEPGKFNIIGGNDNGIFIANSGTTDTIVNGNYIGTDKFGIDLGNNGDGVHITADASSNSIGTASVAGNIISYNRRGVHIAGGRSNTIRNNQIFLNDALGIDLGTIGVTPNDNLDSDAGPNDLQNLPLGIGAAVSPNGQTVTLSGSLHSTPAHFFRIDYYTSASCDASGFGEGSRKIASVTNLQTNLSGNTPLISQNSAVPAGGMLAYVTATATNLETGNTSEFSPCVAVQFQGCAYAISSTNTTIPKSGGGSSFTVSSQTGCGWTATSNASWITTNSTGTGNGTVSYTVAANTGATRTGTITVGGQTFTITQEGTCTYSISPTQANVSGSAGTGSFTVTTQTGCAWSAVSDSPWLYSTSSGTGNGTVNFSYQANTNPSWTRSGRITIGNQLFTLSQSPSCAYTIGHSSINVQPVSGTYTVSVSTASGCAWSATSNANWITTTSSGSGNGIVSYTVAANTGAARTGTITVGGHTFTVNQAAPTSPAIRNVFDFDGDGKTDISIFRPSLGEWWYLKSSNGGNYAAQFGASSDKLTPGDFTGDGKTDIAFFRPAEGFWYVLRSEDGSFYSFPFGTNGDIPFTGDFDADNKSDFGIFRPSDATWYIRRSSDGGTIIQQFGQNGDVPVAADYDGDGKADIAIYRPSLGNGGSTEVRLAESPSNSAARLINPYREISPETEKPMSLSIDRARASGMCSEARIYRFILSHSARAAIFLRRAITTATARRTRRFSVRRARPGMCSVRRRER